MSILAHAILREGCPFAPFNALYERGITVWVLVEANMDEPLQPGLEIGGVGMFEAIVGDVSALHRTIITDIVTKNPDVPQLVRESYIFHGILAIPQHWIASLAVGTVTISDASDWEDAA